MMREDGKIYSTTQSIQRICEPAKLTTGTIQPMRNFLLQGPAVTDKTEGAKAIAAGLHLPYRCLTGVSQRGIRWLPIWDYGLYNCMAHQGR